MYQILETLSTTMVSQNLRCLAWYILYQEPLMDPQPARPTVRSCPCELHNWKLIHWRVEELKVSMLGFFVWIRTLAQKVGKPRRKVFWYVLIRSMFHQRYHVLLWISAMTVVRMFCYTLFRKLSWALRFRPLKRNIIFPTFISVFQVPPATTDAGRHWGCWNCSTNDSTAHSTLVSPYSYRRLGWISGMEAKRMM